MHRMKTLAPLLEQNREWATRIEQEQPSFFEELAKGQSPEILWIGCSDSRVPPGQITGLLPGSIFVHRNIANVVVHTDLNCLSVIQYAIQVLKVKHIIVCGHYGCGGVAHALEEPSLGLIEGWIDNIREVYQIHEAELEALADPQSRKDRLCEFNAVTQVANVCSSIFVQEAWANGQDLSIHGLIFNLADGTLKDLDVSTSGS